ncbi:MAG: acyl carrier protein [Patescibacteria group bacterium]
MSATEFLRLLTDTLGADREFELDTRRADVKEWDSMGQIQILTMLEDKFGVKLEMEELVALESVQDIVNILKLRDVCLN